MPKRPAAPSGLSLYAGASPLGVDRTTRRTVAAAVRRFHEVRESVAAPARTTVVEASVGGAKTTGPGRMLVRLIKAGISLNGNAYPADVLREAAVNKAWAKGCKAYIDHATAEEEDDHPYGSVKNLAAVLTEDARWDEASQSLVAEVRLFTPWRTPLTEMAEDDAIGMSIRAWVTGEHGTYEGRENVFVVARIEAGRSVDFVTVPAAGGGIISVLEAVGNSVPTAEARNAGHWFESRIHQSFTTIADDMFGEGFLNREERIALSSAVGDGLAAFASRIEADAPHLYQRDPYAGPPEQVTTATGEVDTRAHPEPATTGEATHMEPAGQATEDEDAQTSDDDVTDGAPPPAPEPPNQEEEPVSGTQTGAPPEQAGTATVPGNGQPPTTTESAGAVTVDVQANTEALTAAIAAAVEAATRPLTEQITALSARESQRDAENRAARNRQHAGEAVAAALRAPEHTDVAASIAARVTTRVGADVPTTAEGVIDDARLGEVITAVIADEATHVRRERANALAEAGVGMPYGMGGAPAQESADDGLDEELAGLFAGLGMSSEATNLAVKGRG